MNRPDLSPTRLSDRMIALDCLFATKALAARDTFAIVESAHPEARRLFEGMQADHLRMQQEIFEYAKRQGWYPIAHVTHDRAKQHPQSAPVTDSQRYQGFDGYRADQSSLSTYTGSFEAAQGVYHPDPSHAGNAYGLPYRSSHGASQSRQAEPAHGTPGYGYNASNSSFYGEYTPYVQSSQHGPYGEYSQASHYPGQSPPPHLLGDHGFEAADELGEFIFTRPQKKEETEKKLEKQSKRNGGSITRRLE